MKLNKAGKRVKLGVAALYPKPDRRFCPSTPEPGALPRGLLRSHNAPPRLYGGTKRVVSYLTEGMVSLGRQVCLFATDQDCAGGVVEELDRHQGFGGDLVAAFWL